MRLFRIATVAIGLFLLLGSGFASAQDTTYKGLAQLAGLQTGVVRTLKVDVDKINQQLSTPTAEAPSGLLVFTAGVLQFDSEESAAAAVGKASSELAEERQGTPIIVDNVGDESVAFAFAESNGRVDYTGTAIIARSGDQIVLILTFGIKTETQNLAARIATEIIEAPMGDAAVTFDAKGTSSGGLWTKLPTVETAGLDKLPVIEDSTITPPGA